MGNLSRFNTSSNYHSVFGEGGDTSTPPLLDLNEFPSLTARGAGDQAPAAAPPPPGSKPYGSIPTSSTPSDNHNINMLISDIEIIGTGIVL